MITPSPNPIRIGAVGDVHCSRNSTGMLRPFFEAMNRNSDIILLCGDLTDYGLVEEAEILIQELAVENRVPVLAVLGNHDFESGKQNEVRSILSHGGITVLDGESCEFFGIGFAGVKGFGGGFRGRSLEPWGEGPIKSFVGEAVTESLKLEAALARLRTRQRVALLHYAPIRETVEGEPPEIFPFLGSRRLEEPLVQFDVSHVFHGHAHSGSPFGRLSNGASVHNVAMPLLRKLNPQQIPYRSVTLDAEQAFERSVAVGQPRESQCD